MYTQFGFIHIWYLGKCIYIHMTGSVLYHICHVFVFIISRNVLGEMFHVMMLNSS